MPVSGQCLLIRRGTFITFAAGQFPAQHACAPFRRDNPGAIEPGRAMADMLKMSTRQFGDPVVFFVSMKTGDRLLHK